MTRMKKEDMTKTHAELVTILHESVDDIGTIVVSIELACAGLVASADDLEQLYQLKAKLETLYEFFVRYRYKVKHHLDYVDDAIMKRRISRSGAV